MLSERVPVGDELTFVFWAGYFCSLRPSPRASGTVADPEGRRGASPLIERKLLPYSPSSPKLDSVGEKQDSCGDAFGGRGFRRTDGGDWPLMDDVCARKSENERTETFARDG